MNWSDYEEIDIEEFDRLCRAEEWIDGPHISSFGDGYGEPYRPNRDVWGTLANGRKVRSVKKPKVAKVRSVKKPKVAKVRSVKKPKVAPDAKAGRPVSPPRSKRG